jgi:hypothetical protein
MRHCFNPSTGEYIATRDPADWMGQTDKPVPSHDPVVSSAIFNSALGDWEVVFAAVVAPTAQDKIAASLAEIGETRLSIQMAVQLGEVIATMQAAQYGLTSDQAIAYAYANNIAYRKSRDAEAQFKLWESL